MSDGSFAEYEDEEDDSYRMTRSMSPSPFIFDDSGMGIDELRRRRLQRFS